MAYNKPGAYIREAGSEVLTVNNAELRAVGILGTSFATKTVSNFAVVRGTTPSPGAGKVFLASVAPLIFPSQSPIVGDYVTYVTDSVKYEDLANASYTEAVSTVFSTLNLKVSLNAGVYTVDSEGKTVVFNKGAALEVDSDTEIDAMDMFAIGVDTTVEDALETFATLNYYYFVLKDNVFYDTPDGTESSTTVSGLILLTVNNIEGYIVKGTSTEGWLQVVADVVNSDELVYDGTISGVVVPGYPTSSYSFDINTNELVWLYEVKPVDGQTYYVNLTVEKVAADYNRVYTAYTLEDVIKVAGDLYNGSAVNEVSLAASMAFQNGASKIFFVQTPSSSNADFLAGLELMKTVAPRYFVCPTASGNSYKQSLINSYTANQSSFIEKAEVIAFVSALSDDKATVVAQAGGFASDRMVVVFPSQAITLLTNPSTKADDQVTISSTYIGAAIAGRMSNAAADAATPLTRATVSGFYTLGTAVFKNSMLNEIAGAGVLIITEPSPSVFSIRHAITTNPSDVNTSELTIRNIKDSIQQESRKMLEDTYVGKKLFLNTISPRVIKSLESYLTTQVNSQVLNAYKDITVTETTMENPPVVGQVGVTLKIDFKIKPVYTLTWIDITYGLYL